MQPVKLNLKIYQGATFMQSLKWESSTKVYKPITEITKTAPVVITAPAHEIPVGWRARVTNVVGMKEINCSDGEFYIVTDTTPDTVTINSVNAVGYGTYTSGGILEYNAPVSLDNFTARMHIRETLDSEDIIVSLSTENDMIVIDNLYKTITLVLPESVTKDLTISTGVYNLELIGPDNVVYSLAAGNVTVVREVTRNV